MRTIAIMALLAGLTAVPPAAADNWWSVADLRLYD